MREIKRVSLRIVERNDKLVLVSYYLDLATCFIVIKMILERVLTRKNVFVEFVELYLVREVRTVSFRIVERNQKLPLFNYYL